MSDNNINALTSKMASLKVSKRKTKPINTRSIKQRIKNLKTQLVTAQKMLKNKTLKKRVTAPPSKERLNQLLALYGNKK